MPELGGDVTDTARMEAIEDMKALKARGASLGLIGEKRGMQTMSVKRMLERVK